MVVTILITNHYILLQKEFTEKLYKETTKEKSLLNNSVFQFKGQKIKLTNSLQMKCLL